MLKYAVLILWRKKGVPANFYAFCISENQDHLSQHPWLKLWRLQLHKIKIAMKAKIVPDFLPIVVALVPADKGFCAIHQISIFFSASIKD